MKPKDTFTERAVRFAPPDAHYALIVAPDGRFLAADERGGLAVTDEVSDALMWRREGERLHHATSTTTLDIQRSDAACRLTCDGAVIEPEGERGPFAIAHGPERLPSEYLDHLRRHGWVCMAAIMAPDIVDALQRIAGTDGYTGYTQDRKRRQLCQGSALAKTAVEPI